MIPKISILIPVYNVEKYLPKCIESILCQTLTDFEIVLVDDGSSDNSGNICDNYMLRGENENPGIQNIRVFHRNNHGISATREFAVQQARGEYIQFIDSDDWIEPDMLEVMYNKAIESKADVVGCSIDEVHPDKVIPYHFSYGSRDDFLRAVISNQWGVVWKHLIRRDLIRSCEIHFPQNINGGEDYFFMVQTLAFAKKAVTVDKILYHYNRCNVSSTIWNPTENKIMEQVKATRLVVDFLRKLNLYEVYRKEIDTRKFQSKLLLIGINPSLWRDTFPEANYMMWRLSFGKRFLMRCILVRYLKINFRLK